MGLFYAVTILCFGSNLQVMSEQLTLSDDFIYEHFSIFFFSRNGSHHILQGIYLCFSINRWLNVAFKLCGIHFKLNGHKQYGYPSGTLVHGWFVRKNIGLFTLPVKSDLKLIGPLKPLCVHIQNSGQ